MLVFSLLSTVKDWNETILKPQTLGSHYSWTQLNLNRIIKYRKPTGIQRKAKSYLQKETVGENFLKGKALPHTHKNKHSP